MNARTYFICLVGAFGTSWTIAATREDVAWAVSLGCILVWLGFAGVLATVKR